jgi:transcriptional regulator with XRE-family HTH domain
MKTKSFHDYLKTRLTDEEIAEIKRKAQLEVSILKSIKKILSDTMADYMKKNKIGFNEVVRRLSISPSQVAKIQRGEANVTLASFAHFLALMDKEAKDVFKA